MTFVKGVTTWGALADKIVALACGEVADDYGTIVTASNKWRRTAPGIHHISAPAINDVTVTEEHRAGYWQRMDDVGLFNDRVDTAGAFIKTTAIMSGWGTISKPQLFINIEVSVSNTVAGDYSTCSLRIKGQSGDGISSQTLFGSVLVIPNSDGIATFTTLGATWTVQIGSPDGIMPSNIAFYRGFTTEYLGGVDVWPQYGKSTGSPTFSVAPPGVLDTDYKATKASAGGYGFTINGNYFSTTKYPAIKCYGLGIKTNSALTGARYEVSFPVCEAMGAFVYGTTSESSAKTIASSGTTLLFDWGGTAVDGSGTRYYGIEGTQGRGVFPFVTPFSANAVPGALLEYWMSVTPGHISLTVNGDSANSGRISNNVIAKVTQPSGISTPIPIWYMSSIVVSSPRYWYRLGRHYLFDKYRVKGVRDGGRDWQTGIGRGDVFDFSTTIAANNMFAGEVGYLSYRILEVQTDNGTGMDAMPRTTNRTTAQNFVDPRWRMMPAELLSDDFGSTSLEEVPGLLRPSGVVLEGVFKISYSGWSSGDELTDTETGKKYMLWNGGGYGFAGGLYGTAQEEA